VLDYNGFLTFSRGFPFGVMVLPADRLGGGVGGGFGG
jgi:hypothetical protein